jgi:hypothetical protein
MARGGSFLVLICQLRFNDWEQRARKKHQFWSKSFLWTFRGSGTMSKICKIASRRRLFYARSSISVLPSIRVAPRFSLWTPFSNGWIISLH